MTGRETRAAHTCPTLETWCAYVDDSLAEEEKKALDQHRQHCDRCFSTLETLRHEQKQTMHPTPPELLSQAQKKRPARRWLGYAAAAALAVAIGAALLQKDGPPLQQEQEEILFVEAAYDDVEIGFAKVRKNVAAKGQVEALVIYAQFKNEASQGREIPDFAEQLFDRDLPGSFSHFYSTMSFGQLEVRGTVLKHRYTSRRRSNAYLARAEGEEGLFGEFALEILEAVDSDVDFAQFDNDGPDQIPNSGDDDGRVDYLFINVRTTPRHFIRAGATGAGILGFEGDYATADLGYNGQPIRISPVLGTLIGASSFSRTVGTMAHEFGHSLGLPDLYDLLYENPAEDSAGIGKWGLMGWGTHGWGGNDGPNPFCAWSREKLGWLGPDNEQLIEVRGDQQDLEIADLHAGGKVYKIPLRRRFMSTGLFVEEYLLLEYRSSQAHFYNRHQPGDGLLIWHIRPGFENNLLEETKVVDLVSADGLYADAGFPQGRSADPFFGRDNLDFWAHDANYRNAHAGNMGDGGDPFDGERYTRFDLASNPSVNMRSHLTGASSGLALHMRRQGDAIRVDITRPRWAGIITDEVVLLDKIIIDGDLTIAAEGRLVVYPTARIYFAGSDRLKSGQDPALSELLIEGGLAVIPRALQQKFNRWSWKRMEIVPPQAIYLQALEPGTTWYGIVEGTNAQLDIPANSLVIQDAVFGLRSFADAISPPAEVATAVAGNPDAALPQTPQLLPNYPNPFNSQTTIPYALPQQTQVRLSIYNTLGQVVRVLVDEQQSAGRHEAIWDSRDESGQRVASGVYLYLLDVAGQRVIQRKMSLVQ